MCAPHIGHIYDQAQGLSLQKPLDVMIYIVMWSQGTQDGLTIIEEPASSGHPEEPSPPNPGSEQKLGTLSHCPRQQRGPKEEGG